MSIDGYIDTATDERLVLSNDADLDRVACLSAGGRDRSPIRA
jgi:5-amino-6-(5-phosphoribosylamino)uracil reductase